MKRIIALIIMMSSVGKVWSFDDKKRVYISQIVKHPALDRTTQGIIDGLQANEDETDIKLDIRVEYAHANPTLSSQIAGKFIGKEAHIVVGVSTLSAQSFIRYAKTNKAKLVFSSVTDPVAAGLVQSLKKPGYAISGVSNFVDLEPQILLFQAIQPELKRLGFLYNPSEVNSIQIKERLQKVCKKVGITLILKTANSTKDISQAATYLSSHVDALFISNDSTALSSLKAIVAIANHHRIPVYVSDTDAVELGALAALGPNQYKIGLQTAKIILRALQSENLATIPVEFPKETDLFLNQEAAKRLGLQFDNKIIAAATRIIGDTHDAE